MHDPKFEQEVQRKMHDLEFVPSEAVWENIRQNMAPRQRRRLIAAFWWWLAPGLLALTAGGVFYFHSRTSSVAAVRDGKAAHPAVVVGSGKANASVAAGKADGGVAHGQADNSDVSAANGQEATTAGKTASGHGSPSHANTANRQVEMANRNLRKPGEMADVGVAGAGSDVAWIDGSEAGARPGAGTATARRPPMGYRPHRISGFASRGGVGAPQLYPGPVNTAVSGIRQPSHPWKVGFVAGGGASVMAGSQTMGVGYGASGNTSFAPQAIGSSAPQKRILSNVKPDLSYSAGVYGEKRISSRWSVDIGLDLHYYSARLESNEQLNTYVPPSLSLFQASSITPGTNYGSNYYSADSVQTYLNRYFFMEIPVALEWRINRSRLLPLFWRGGAVFSYLMSSDAVYLDSRSGNYYKSNGIARRGQASLQTGLMVGLPVRGLEIKAGPEVQYAVTSMLRSGYTGGHLVYGGMRVAVMR